MIKVITTVMTDVPLIGAMCSCRKYPYSPYRRDWKFLGGRAFCKTKKVKEM